MTRLRVALLNAAHDGTHTRRNFRRDVDADLVEFDATNGQLPPVGECCAEFDACLVSGSRASVYWDETWIRDTQAWVREAHDAGLPFLGICWGHQLLAEALGGTVEDMGEYEIGYRTVSHRGGRLFDGIDEEFLVFTTHSDHVAELPPGGELLAENDYGVHGFQKGHAFGVQFHPEYDTETAEEVTRGKDLDPERKGRVLDGITRENFLRASEAKALFDNFLGYVRELRVQEVAGESRAVGD